MPRRGSLPTTNAGAPPEGNENACADTIGSGRAASQVVTGQFDGHPTSIIRTPASWNDRPPPERDTMPPARSTVLGLTDVTAVAPAPTDGSGGKGSALPLVATSPVVVVLDVDGRVKSSAPGAVVLPPATTRPNPLTHVAAAPWRSSVRNSQVRFPLG